MVFNSFAFFVFFPAVTALYNATAGRDIWPTATIGAVGHLADVSTHLPEREAAKFQKVAKAAELRCPISRALNVPIKMTAKLEPVEEVALV